MSKVIIGNIDLVQLETTVFGLSGSIGATGPTGPQGLTGSQGPTGSTGAAASLPSGTIVLLNAHETEITGTTTSTSVKSYTVPANTYTFIMAESECGFISSANTSGNVRFEILYDGVIKRNAVIEFDATGSGDQHAAGYTLKYTEAFTAGGVIRVDAQNVANGTWAVESLRVYGVI